MSRIVTVAATQMACSWDSAANIANAEKLVRQAAAQGAQIILIQELFETPYFCQKPNPQYLQLATPVEQNPAIQHFQKLAAELQVVLPISFFERAGRARATACAACTRAACAARADPRAPAGYQNARGAARAGTQERAGE